MRSSTLHGVRVVAVAVAVFWGIAAAHAADGVHFEPSPVPPLPPAALEAEPDVSSLLDPAYDRYLAWKQQVQDRYKIEYSVQLSLLPQAATRGGFGGLDFIWTPSLVWAPFADTALGSGTVTFWAQQNQFWKGPNTTVFKNRAGLLTPPNDWGPNAVDYAVLTYTHTLPGDWRWLSATIGQYSFGSYDGNRYAGNFVNYALAQNATAAYVNGDLGAYLQADMPGPGLVMAGGLQGAENFSASTISSRGIATGKEAYFAAAQWRPKFLAGGQYGLLWYSQPALPGFETTASRGLSFSAVQDIDHDWGLFLRANTAGGADTDIAASVAWGVVRNDPLRRSPLDRLGLGLVWDRTNPAAIVAPARASEWVAEAYYDYAIFKGLQIAPDLQFYFNPALAPHSGPVAVFTLRATLSY